MLLKSLSTDFSKNVMFFSRSNRTKIRSVIFDVANENHLKLQSVSVVALSLKLPQFVFLAPPASILSLYTAYASRAQENVIY